MIKETQEFIFKQSVNLLIKGAINQGVDLVDVAYWLKDIVNYDDYDIKGEIEEEGYYEKNKEDLA